MWEGQLLLTGDVISLRRLFAFVEVKTRYRDLATIDLLSIQC
jgi:hypothetical protein